MCSWLLRPLARRAFVVRSADINTWDFCQRKHLVRMATWSKQNNFPSTKLAMVCCDSYGLLMIGFEMLIQLAFCFAFWLELNLQLMGFTCAALHEIDPVFKTFSCSEKLSSLMLSLGYKRPVIIQSMYIFKVLDLLYNCILVSSYNFFWPSLSACGNCGFSYEKALLYHYYDKLL